MADPTAKAPEAPVQPDAASAAAGSAGSSEPALSDSKASGGNIAEQADQRADAHLSVKPVAGEVDAALEAALAAVEDTDALPVVDVGTAEGQEAMYNWLIRNTPVSVGKKASAEERDRRGLRYTTLTYGEIAYKPFVAALRKIEEELEGAEYMGGVFYDIGAGTGKPVFAAALYGQFKSCVGIEILDGLYELSQGLLQGYKENVQRTLPLLKQSTHVQLLHGDFTEMDVSDADVWFANSTCFNEELMDKLALACEHQKVGTFGITFTKRLPSHKWKVLSSELHQMSWGPATVHIQRKALP